MYVSGMSGMGDLVMCPGGPGCPGSSSSALWDLPTTDSSGVSILSTIPGFYPPSSGTTTGAVTSAPVTQSVSSWLSANAGMVALAGGAFFLVVMLARAGR